MSTVQSPICCKAQRLSTSYTVMPFNKLTLILLSWGVEAEHKKTAHWAVFYLQYLRSRKIHGPFERAGLAHVVAPENLELVAVLGALEPETDQRVFGNAGADVHRRHDLAIVFQRHPLDEMRRDFLAGVFVGAQTGFHRVHNQQLQLNAAILGAGAHFHLAISHSSLPRHSNR